MKNTIALASIGILLSAAAAQALPAISTLSTGQTEASEARLLLTGSERKRVQLGKNRSAAFRAGGLKDFMEAGRRSARLFAVLLRSRRHQSASIQKEATAGVWQN